MAEVVCSGTICIFFQVCATDTSQVNFGFYLPWSGRRLRYIFTPKVFLTLKVMIEENVPERAQDIGAYFKEQLATLKERHDYIIDIRGMGLLIGMELSCKGAPVVTACLNKGFVINCIQERVLRFLPPLKIERKMIDALVVCLDTVLTEMKL